MNRRWLTKSNNCNQWDVSPVDLPQGGALGPLAAPAIPVVPAPIAVELNRPRGLMDLVVIEA